ncbi:MAG: ABC transporter permease [Anaerolineaceae bacterium]|nr:ABC transporter permease [Anaerolineaceae bacterium]
MSSWLAPAGVRREWQKLLPVAMLLLVAVWQFSIASSWLQNREDAPAVTESTLGQLVLWLLEQAEDEEPRSLLGQLARARFEETGDLEKLTIQLLSAVRWLHIVLSTGNCFLALAIAYAIWRNWQRLPVAMAILILANGAHLFLYSPSSSAWLFQSIIALGWLILVILFLHPTAKNRIVAFLAIVSVLLLSWETIKLAAELLDYRVTRPLPDWQYETRADLTSALDQLAAGEVDVVIADRRLLDDLMPPHPATDRQTEEERNALPRQELRYERVFNRSERYLFFPVEPAVLPRLSIAVRAADAGRWTSTADLRSLKMVTDEGSFADERYLAEPRSLVLLNLRIFNDLNLPHLQSIAQAFLQPARRNGPFLLISILSGAGLFTLSEAALGFAIGAALGFVLGTIFAHSPFLERSLLPFVVASQTVPILAFAPMVVIWLGASAVSVAVIAAYLTFFPVTINTLRGLLSPSPIALELMRSYAASRLETLWKLRIPAALPYIFTALKVSATASVVGAIIGELPSGISAGLGRAILNFSSDYSLVSTPKLWASIVTAAGIGILFFVTVSLVEWRALRQARNVS